MALSTPETAVRESLANGTNLRDLDPFEEFFFLTEQRLSRLSVLAGEVDGSTRIAVWHQAAGALQARYPLLSATIRKVRGQRPFFAASDEPLTIRVLPIDTLISVEQEMQTEMQQPFGNGDRPLLRITIFHGVSRSVVFVASHHAAFDGTSNLMVMQDLLFLVSGEEPGPIFFLQLGLSKLFELKEPSAYSRLLPLDTAINAGSEFLHESATIHTHVLRLDEQETQELIRRSRREGTSVHGALLAALVLAGKSHSESWRSQPVMTLSPVDVRAMLGLPAAAGMILTLHPLIFDPSDDQDFWNSARAVKASLRLSQSRDGAANTIAWIGTLFVDEQTPAEVYAAAQTAPLAHHLMLTNYGAYKMRTDYKALHLDSLYSGAANGLPGTQKVSVLTTNGRLSMTLVSQEPFPRMLETGRTILRDAIAIAFLQP